MNYPQVKLNKFNNNNKFSNKKQKKINKKN